MKLSVLQWMKITELKDASGIMLIIGNNGKAELMEQCNELLQSCV